MRLGGALFQASYLLHTPRSIIAMATESIICGRVYILCILCTCGDKLTLMSSLVPRLRCTAFFALWKSTMQDSGAWERGYLVSTTKNLWISDNACTIKQERIPNVASFPGSTPPQLTVREKWGVEPGNEAIPNDCL